MQEQLTGFSSFEKVSRQHQHNLALAVFGKGILHSVTSNKTPIPIPKNNQNTKSIFHPNTFSNMTMKHPREDQLLLGSDHSKTKRPRTSSDASETSAIENKSSNIILGSGASVHNHSSNNTLSSKIKPLQTKHGIDSSRSPRMMALLYSVDDEARKLGHKWPQPPSASSTVTSSSGPSSQAPAPAPDSTALAAAVLLQQKQQKPQQTRPATTREALNFCQPLVARPRVHKIKEVAPTTESSAASPAPTPEPRESPPASSAPAPATATLDNIKAAVEAAAPAAIDAYNTAENNAATITAVNAVLAQHRIAGAAVAAQTGFPTNPSPAPTPSIPLGGITKSGRPLHALSFPTLVVSTAAGANTSYVVSNPRYDATYLHHGNRPLPFRGPTARQQAIHDAVHSDYKKVYRPLQQPPRLPSPQEALVIAAISTATSPACR